MPLFSSFSKLFGPVSAEAAPVSTNSSNKIYFQQTAHYVRDAFLNYWLMNGGAAIYGYPISEETSYNGQTIQYFERSRFEYNPNSTRPWHVDLTPVGTVLTEGRIFAPPDQTASTSDRTYFEQTKHTLGGSFGQFWKAGGGEPIFGYPISEELSENGTTVQYFERTRMELVRQGRVQLARLGVDLLSRHLLNGLPAAVAHPVNRPGFSMTFRGEATWFHADWERVIRLNQGWGNLPPGFVGRGLYAAAPADLNLYGRWARVTRGNRSIFVQFVDEIASNDVPYVRSKGIVIDLGEESYHALGQDTGGRYDVTFDLLWPGDEP
ncbi:MAG: RlpA-like double-psi beta-barrel domain-containing protein [Chloroflexota bacterium]|nr:RlpA-like double-psi beta-barrel domain-containing protein [Chloroflexota bacterium]